MKLKKCFIANADSLQQESLKTSVNQNLVVEGNETISSIQYLDAIASNDMVLFFDLDGTLVDTNFANYLSYKKAIQSVIQSECNITYCPDERFNRSLLKNVIPNLTEMEYEAIIREKEKYYNDFLSETQINREIAIILYKYFKTNKTVLVTNCRKDRALATLNYHNLTDKFSNLFFRQFSNNKINKFENAIQSLKISPKLVIAFENEETEIVDAKITGIQIINPINL